MSEHLIHGHRSDGVKHAGELPSAKGQQNPLESPAGQAPRVSVIIPLHRDSDGFRRCLSGCLGLDYSSFEIIVVSDYAVAVPPAVKLVLSGAGRNTGPGEKRDLGMAVATGDYLAFIDDDASPRSDWLTEAIRVLQDPTVGAVAGPGVTPEGSSWTERVGGAFYESWLGSGPYRYRFRRGRARDVDDYPAYNLIVRREAAAQVNGWGTGFYGGEDTVICLALVAAGWRIVYDPAVVVFHQRRPILSKHLLQVANVGLHRGYFVKAYPKTSLRLSYFLPTLGTLLLTTLVIAALVDPIARTLVVASLVAYVVGAVALSFVETKDLTLAMAVPLVAPMSHVTYGLQFIRGLITPRLDR